MGGGGVIFSPAYLIFGVVSDGSMDGGSRDAPRMEILSMPEPYASLHSCECSRMRLGGFGVKYLHSNTSTDFDTVSSIGDDALRVPVASKTFHLKGHLTGVPPGPGGRLVPQHHFVARDIWRPQERAKERAQDEA